VRQLHGRVLSSPCNLVLQTRELQKWPKVVWELKFCGPGKCPYFEVSITSREVLGIEAHISKSLVLWGLSLPPPLPPFVPSQFPLCPSLPHFPLTTACPLCQASPVDSPIALSPCWFPMSACPVSMSKSVYFVRPDYICHHWQRELFYSLVLWRDCVCDFE